jgi:Putative peptidoglycan binding domain
MEAEVGVMGEGEGVAVTVFGEEVLAVMDLEEGVLAVTVSVHPSQVLAGAAWVRGLSGTRGFADRGFFDRGVRGRFDRGAHFGRFDRDDRFFFRRNFFVGFDFAAFGFPGWWDGGYPYDYGYYPYGNAYYGDDASYGDASTFDYEYWNNLAVSVQSELSRSGYYTGQIDGVIGSGSRQAIREFQAKQKLPVTGRIEPKLLDSLGIGYNRRQS